MKYTALLISTVALSLSAAVQADDAAKSTVVAGETHEQKCSRWADYQGLKDSIRAEYVKDCQLDLRIPDKKEEGGGD